MFNTYRVKRLLLSLIFCYNLNFLQHDPIQNNLKMLNQLTWRPLKWKIIFSSFDLENLIWIINPSSFINFCYLVLGLCWKLLSNNQSRKTFGTRAFRPKCLENTVKINIRCIENIYLKHYSPILPSSFLLHLL